MTAKAARSSGEKRRIVGKATHIVLCRAALTGGGTESYTAVEKGIHHQSRNRQHLVWAFPPVAVLLVNAAPALQLGAELIAPLARFRRLGVIGVAAATRRIRRKPPLNERRLRVGRGGKSEDEAGQGQRERNGRDDPPRPTPAPRVRARGGQRIVGRLHPARVPAASSRRKRLDWAAIRQMSAGTGRMSALGIGSRHEVRAAIAAPCAARRRSGSSPR